MDASTVLARLSGLLAEQGIEAILIGNAAAALQGAPVTTDDLDFLFRPTPRNVSKLRALARFVGADLTQPSYPLSHMYRIVDPLTDVQLDMMGQVFGVKSFESVRSRSTDFAIGAETVKVASLSDVISMKKAANRTKDRAVMPLLEETLREVERTEE